MKRLTIRIFSAIIICLVVCSCHRNGPKTAYIFPDPGELPLQEGMQDPFLREDGSRVKTPEEWKAQREYLKKMLTHYHYGEMPPKPEKFDIEPISGGPVYNDSVLEETFHMILTRDGRTTRFKVGIRRPNRDGKFPVIIKNDSWVFDINEVKEAGRRAKYLQLERDRIEDYVAREAASRGYVICKFNRTEVAADNKGGRNTGIMALYPEYEWGTITAWAWAYQLILDHLETLNYVDAEKSVATGHSRGGKTALCAGIYEERIAVTAPSSSGGGGTGSWRYFEKGKDPQLISHHHSNFPWWWKPLFYTFSDKEDYLPWDAHTLKALIAPRGLINVHSRDDYWANPYGTHLTYLAADIVFEWLGAGENHGVHWRNGPHNQNYEDWHAIFEFCDRYFFGKSTDIDFTLNPRPDSYRFDGLIEFKAP